MVEAPGVESAETVASATVLRKTATSGSPGSTSRKVPTEVDVTWATVGVSHKAQMQAHGLWQKCRWWTLS